MAPHFLIAKFFGDQDQTQANATCLCCLLCCVYKEREQVEPKSQIHFIYIDFQNGEKFYMRPAKLRRREQNLIVTHTQSLPDKN